jgi:hypothetical protein
MKNTVLVYLFLVLFLGMASSANASGKHHGGPRAVTLCFAVFGPSESGVDDVFAFGTTPKRVRKASVTHEQYAHRSKRLAYQNFVIVTSCNN